MTPRKSKEASENPATVKTPYWAPEEIGVAPIAAPPNPTGQDGLAIGDVFYYRMQSNRYQLWLWMVGLHGEPRWMPVRYGYRRDDGRWLIVTPSTNVPSWVSTNHYSRLKHGQPSLLPFIISMS